MKLGWRVYEYGLIDATFFNSFSGLRDLTIQLPIYKLLSSCHRGPDSNQRGGKTHKISLIFSHRDGERVLLKCPVFPWTKIGGNGGEFDFLNPCTRKEKRYEQFVLVKMGS